MGFENNFNGIYFHRHFYLKTSVSRNGLSPDYSEQDTSSVLGNVHVKPYFNTQCRGGGGVITPLPPGSNDPALAVAVKQIASGSEMSHEEEEQSRLQPFVRCL